MQEDDLIGLVVTLIYWGGIIAFATWLVLHWSARVRKLKAGGSLAEFAKVVGGELVQPSSSEYPALRFHRDGRRFFFIQWVMGTTHPVVSTLEAALGTEAFFEATGTRAVRYPSRFPRARHARAPWGYRVVTTDPAWAEGLLDRGVKSILKSLRRKLGKTGRIQLTSGRFTVEVERLVRPRELPVMLDLMDRLIRVLEGDSADGKIVILESGFDPARGRCPICAEPAGTHAVTCRECRVPHHRDCWTFAGRCGIFGCGSRTAA